MATGNITLPEGLLPQLEKLAQAENRTASDLARQVLEQYVRRRLAASELEELSAWGQQHAKTMGYKPSDVQQAIVDSRRERNGR